MRMVALMLERLPRPLALLVLGLFVLAGAWCFAAPSQAPDVAAARQYTDLQLFRDITARVAQGVPYHEAAAQLHRAHAYPLKPFVTVREPALFVLAAWLGWPTMQALAFGLVGGALAAWAAALRPLVSQAERLGALAGIALACLAIANVGLLAGTEPWTGLLLSIALACRIRGLPRAELAVVGAALLLRELALPYALLALAFAALRREWRVAGRWLALIGLFTAAMAVHAHFQLQTVRAGDIVSPGWAGGLGLRGFLMGVAYTSVWQVLPQPQALLLALLPALGWMALTGRGGLFAQLLLGGYALMLMLFARSDNFYWGFTVMPMWFAGYALLPRACGQLARAIRTG